jgi:uncharacterized protein (DUF488 family)
MNQVYTVGHSTRSAAEFLALLQGAGVACLVDVRRYAASRRYPHFNRENLHVALRAAGIDYVHMPALGGRRTSSADSPNRFWRSASFRAYADYMSDPEFQAAFLELEALARASATAIMCAEAVPWRCHRQLIADALTARGWQVFHILNPGKLDRHELNAAARVQADGTLMYPEPAEPAESPQGTLFE